MKARPRRIENRVAEILSAQFEASGMAPVERIPVLGRRGPDLTWNEMKLIVDVKSRKACPKSFIHEGLFRHQNLLACPLSNLAALNALPMGDLPPSKQVNDWFNHMHEWTKEEQPDGITTIVLHLPGLPVGRSALVIHENDHLQLQATLKEMKL